MCGLVKVFFFLYSFLQSMCTFKVYWLFVIKVFKEGGQVITQQLGNITRKIWKGETLQKLWRGGALLGQTYKKGEYSYRNYSDRISLLCPAYKVVSNILINKLILYTKEIVKNIKQNSWKENLIWTKFA